MLQKIFMLSFILFTFTNTSVLAGDPEKGKKAFKKCAACHNAAEGAKHKSGPNLWGIYGAKAGVQDGYKYSDWLKGAGIEWNDEALAAWVSKKKAKAEYFGKDVKKSKMIFSGLRKPEQITNVIAYIKTLK